MVIRTCTEGYDKNKQMEVDLISSHSNGKGADLIFIFMPSGYAWRLRHWIQGSKVEKHWMAPRSTQPFIFWRLTKWVPATPGDLVVKSKLSPRIGYVVLRQLNPILQKGPWSFFWINGNNHYSITRTAPITEYLKQHDTCSAYIVDL